jgi:CubicO group peptidase (beta-lactamase class C family)
MRIRAHLACRKNACYTWAAILLLQALAGAAAPRQQTYLEQPRFPPRSAITNRAELEAFMDGLMAAQTGAHHLAGAAICVVAGGQVVLAKGYGYADISKGRKVDPETTLFRIGSVSKLFVWTAVMQLVEQGKLELNEDVNSYLKGLRIPATYREPITMTHLMSHTAGFEESVIGLFAGSPDRLRPLLEILSRDLPMRVRPPGLLASYSNHGTALAGLIVEDVCRTDWARYVEQKILEPLGMKHSTARQPVPPLLSGDLAVGYEFSGGDFRPREFEFVPLAPAGSISASAGDMGRFMIAHLQNGRLGQARILSEKSAQQMRGKLFTHDPRLNGLLHGFLEMNRNGQKIIGHGGDTFLFHSILLLLPEYNAGLFASYNSNTGGDARNELITAFLDRYYPAKRTSTPPAANPGSQLHDGRYAGLYAPLRVSHTTLAKIALLLTTVRVEATSDGRLRTSGAGAAPRLWVEQEPMFFREVNGPNLMAFRQDESGKITHLFFGSVPAIAFARLPWFEHPAFHGMLAGTCIGLIASGLVLWPVLALRNSGRRLVNSPPRMARFLAWAAGATLVAFLAGTAVILGNPGQIAFGVPTALQHLLYLPLIAMALGMGMIVFTILAWQKHYWHFAGRLHYTLVAFATVGLLLWLDYWNLIGFRY